MRQSGHGEEYEAKPERSPSTRQRVLDAACERFAGGGFYGATHQAICSAAGANIAAINYYFDSKESLYEAAFERAYQLMQDAHPLPRVECLDPRTAVEQVLRAHLKAAVDPGPGGWFHRLLHHEWTNPSPAGSDIRKHYVEPAKAGLSAVVAAYLQKQASEATVRCAAFCLYSQCLQLCAASTFAAQCDDGLTGHGESGQAMLQLITEFCMAGVDRVASLK